jgi:hypothetical protein
MRDLAELAALLDDLQPVPVELWLVDPGVAGEDWKPAVARSKPPTPPSLRSRQLESFLSVAGCNLGLAAHLIELIGHNYLSRRDA